MEEYRRQIDAIDGKLLELFRARLRVAEQIGEYKKEKGLPICDPVREEQMLSRYRSMAGEQDGEAIEKLFRQVIEVSKERQRKVQEQ